MYCDYCHEEVPRDFFCDKCCNEPEIVYNDDPAPLGDLGFEDPEELRYYCICLNCCRGHWTPSEGPEQPETKREPIVTSDDEKAVCDHLVQAWKLWLQLDDKHPDDVDEFRFHVHALQNMLAWRVARRADPEVWGAAPPESDR